MFTITCHKGVRIKFENGWTISIQWGPTNYCDHHFLPDFEVPANSEFWTSEKAEIAIFNSTDNFHRPEGWGDDVKGYLTPNEVLEWINYTAQK